MNFCQSGNEVRQRIDDFESSVQGSRKPVLAMKSISCGLLECSALAFQEMALASRIGGYKNLSFSQLKASCISWAPFSLGVVTAGPSQPSAKKRRDGRLSRPA